MALETEKYALWAGVALTILVLDAAHGLGHVVDIRALRHRRRARELGALPVHGLPGRGRAGPADHRLCPD